MFSQWDLEVDVISILVTLLNYNIDEQAID